MIQSYPLATGVRGFGPEVILSLIEKIKRWLLGVHLNKHGLPLSPRHSFPVVLMKLPRYKSVFTLTPISAVQCETPKNRKEGKDLTKLDPSPSLS